MAEELSIRDEELEVAGSSLIDAAVAIAVRCANPPTGGSESFGAAFEELMDHVRAVTIARGALADAARTGAEALASLMRESSEFDRLLAGALGDGFVLRGELR